MSKFEANAKELRLSNYGKAGFSSGVYIFSSHNIWRDHRAPTKHYYYYYYFKCIVDDSSPISAFLIPLWP
jgi:hypothetical protein